MCVLTLYSLFLTSATEYTGKPKFVIVAADIYLYHTVYSPNTIFRVTTSIQAHTSLQLHTYVYRYRPCKLVDGGRQPRRRRRDVGGCGYAAPTHRPPSIISYADIDFEPCQRERKREPVFPKFMQTSSRVVPPSAFASRESLQPLPLLNIHSAARRPHSSNEHDRTIVDTLDTNLFSLSLPSCFS